MINYIITFLILVFVYKGVKLFLNLRKHKKKCGIMPGAEPFFYKRGKTGVLLLHGFTSTPQEVKMLGRYLASKGLTVYAPLLPGHGTCPEDLARTKRDDWINAAEKAVDELKKTTSKIFVGGSSFGANLAILAAKNKKIDGFLCLGMPVIFRRNTLIKKVIVPFLSITRTKKFLKKRYKKRDKEVVKHKIHYKLFPLNCFLDVMKILNMSKQDLPNIKIPTLVMQSTKDYQVDENNAYYIYHNISSKKKKIIFIPDAYHVFIMDKNGRKYFKDIYEFIKEN